MNFSGQNAIGFSSPLKKVKPAPRLGAQSAFGAFIALGLAMSLAGSSPAQDVVVVQELTSLIDGEPYDVITLNEESRSAGDWKVLPLEFPNRRVPKDRPGEEKFPLRMLERPERLRECEWRYVVKIDLFEDLVLAEAEKFVGLGRFDLAFRNYAYVLERQPNYPGLKEGLERYLFADAAAAFRAGRASEALAVLDELHRQDPNRGGLAAAISRTLDGLIEGYIRAKKYRAALALVLSAETRYGSAQKPTADRWKERLAAAAAAQRDRAQGLFAAGNYRDAHRACRTMLDIWPEIEGGRELAAQVADKYPLVTVGVMEAAPRNLPALDTTFAARRARRLSERTMTEFQGFGPEGSQYASPLGSLELSVDGLELRVKVAPRNPAAASGQNAANDGLTGYDVARRVMQLVDPQAPDYRPPLAGVLARTEVDNVYDAVLKFHRPHLRPQALLQAGLAPAQGGNGGDAAESTGGASIVCGYVRDRGEGEAAESDETAWTLNPAYVFQTASQPREIVERAFPDSQQALSALALGQIDAIDRLYPADVSRARRMNGVTVGRYSVPTLHFLAINPRSPYLKQRAFRRALVYALPREQILNGELLGNQRIEGCRVVSGPLPPGVASDDPLGYAYDSRLTPRGYDARLAMALTAITRNELAEAAKKSNTDPPELAPLILVHSPAEICRVAAQAIAQHWQAAGIPCELRELPADGELGDDWDLLYLEASMSDPAIELPQWFASPLLAANASPYLVQAVRRLEGAPNWTEARNTLREIHRLAHEEVAVVPLWQLVEHYAHRESLSGAGQNAATLYQQVEEWQVK